MRGLFDINLLIALLDGGHTLHERAHAWWSANLSAGWASCPLTENGLIRIMSNPAYRSKIHLSPSFLAAQLALFAVETNHEFWPDSLSFRDDRYFGLDQMQTGRREDRIDEALTIPPSFATQHDEPSHWSSP